MISIYGSLPLGWLDYRWERCASPSRPRHIERLSRSAMANATRDRNPTLMRVKPCTSTSSPRTFSDAESHGRSPCTLDRSA